MSYTPQHWPIFCTKLVFGGVVYRTIVHYSFTQSGDPIQNYFLSSAFSEGTITGNMTFSHTRLRVLFFWPDCGSFPFIHCSPPPLGLNAIYNPRRPPRRPPHRALSGALSRPDSAAVRRTVWFFCRVWPFDWWSYWNKKEIKLYAAPEHVPVVSTIFYAWQV